MSNLFNSTFYNILIEDLGEAIAWQIAFELGGQKLYIPQKPKKQHIFSKYGKEFFTWIINNYGGDTIVIPVGPSNAYKRNMVQAENLILRGFTANQIASTLKIHHSSAIRAKNRVKNNSQLSFL